MTRIIAFLSAFCLIGCSTVGNHITDSPKAWINVNKGLNGFFSNEIFWCDATKEEPVCVRPQYRGFESPFYSTHPYQKGFDR